VTKGIIRTINKPLYIVFDNIKLNLENAYAGKTLMIIVRKLLITAIIKESKIDGITLLRK
jgi:hypothetical protein